MSYQVESHRSWDLDNMVEALHLLSTFNWPSQTYS
jgi:hypothetical protein